MLPRGVAIALAAMAAVLAAVPTAQAAPPVFKGASANGEIVYFESEEQLVPGDTDTRRDVYERSFDLDVGAYVTRQMSLGPTGGNDAYTAQLEAVSEDGTRVFFSTDEGLVATDTDRREDVYMRDLEAAATTLVSAGDAGCAPCGNGTFGVSFAGADADGEAVFFSSDERLVPGDLDTATDLYVRHLPDPADPVAEKTELVSTGSASCPSCGNGEFPVSPRGISADGSHAYFVTGEQLSTADGDSAHDIYAHDVGSAATFPVSTGECTPACGDSGAVPFFGGSSADGDRVFFSTSEKLSGSDADTATDVYARDLPAGPTVLVSGGGGDFPAEFEAASADGSQVFFTTTEAIDPGDVDSGANDVYEWSGGSATLVTPATCAGQCGGASFDAASADASQVVFSTAEPLDPKDTDSSVDVYRQQVGSATPPVFVSVAATDCSGCGNEAAEARFNRASADASHVSFTTKEGLRAEDVDGENDIYARDLDGGTTSLITTSPSYCPQTKGNCGATFAGTSSDGQHVFFSSIERFTLDDGDKEADVYERFLGTSPSEEETRLVSTGNDPNLELGPPPPVLTATDPPSPGNSTTPRILGQAEAGSLIKLYATPECDGEPVATGTAAQLSTPGLQAAVAAASLNTFRATAEAEGFVSTCSAPISYQESSQAAPGGGSGDGGGDSGGGSTGGGIFRPARGGTETVTSSKQQVGPAFVVPRTRITFAPAAKTRSRNPVFRFTDSTGQPGTRFQCKVDRGGWRPCSSPLRLKRLSRGRHVLEVLATNAVGTVEPAAVRRAFKVVPR